MASWLDSLQGVRSESIPGAIREALVVFGDAASAWTECDDAAALLWLAYHATEQRAEAASFVDRLTAELNATPSAPPSRAGSGMLGSSGPVSGWTTDSSGAATYDVTLLLRQSIEQRRDDAPAYGSVPEGLRSRYRDLVRAKLKELAPRVRQALQPPR